MKIYLIVGKYRDNYPGETMPTILDSWDEYVRDDNPEGYHESLAKYQDQVGRGYIAGVKELTIEIPDEAVTKLFEPSEYVLEADVIA